MSRLSLSRFRPLWIACALALAARAEAAGKPATPVGWVLNFNYGAGNLSMEGDSLGRDFGKGLQLRVGHIIDPKFQAGFQLRAWSSSEHDSLHGSSSGFPELSRNVQLVTMNATMYPSGSGPYVRGGAGICRVRQEFLAHDPLGGPSVQQTHEDAGFAVSAAGGWEYKWRARIGFALDAEYTRLVAAHVGGNLFTYTAGFNIYW
jgi:outer membrane protein with beta-barrel domain